MTARFLAVVLLLGLSVLPSSGCVPAEGEARPGGELTAVPSLTLILAGDVMLGRGVAQALNGDWKAAFAGVRPWLGAPSSQPGSGQVLFVANLESPLTALPQIKEGYDLRAPPEAVAALRAAGLDALSLANNHTLDAGEAGLDETADTLREAGIVPWMDAAPVAMAGTISVCGLAFDDSAASLDIDAAAAAIAAAAARAEVVVVSIHWGGEYQAAPGEHQQAVARALSEAGATLIAGHGPHVLQRVEWVGETLVAYSLGNFLFDQRYPIDCRWGALLRVTLQGAQIAAVDAVPTVSERGRVQRADDETAQAIMDRLGLETIKQAE